METSDRPVVVAFDGSPDALRALDWALANADGPGRRLRVVVARGDLFSLSAWADEWTRGLAQEWLDVAKEYLDARGATAELSILDGMPSEVLVAQSARAELLVLGSRGHGRIGEVLQGSVSQHVTHHSACPVVVVRDADVPASDVVVVGMDGSGNSLLALDFALAHAKANQLRLRVVHVAEPWRGLGALPPAELVPELIAEQKSRDDAVIRAANAALVDHPDVEAEVEQIEGRPERVLTDESRHAALLVVGTHGRGFFAGMALGSVSSHVLRTAGCPVAVVP